MLHFHAEPKSEQIMPSDFHELIMAIIADRAQLNTVVDVSGGFESYLRSHFFSGLHNQLPITFESRSSLVRHTRPESLAFAPVCGWQADQIDTGMLIGRTKGCRN